MFIDLHHAGQFQLEQAAAVLLEAFTAKGIREWSTIDDARREVYECLDKRYFCFGWAENDDVVGWIGLRPMYSTVTWELHPLVVRPDHHGAGIGRSLVQNLEHAAARSGVCNIVLGTDDQTGATSLSELDFAVDSVPAAIESIRNKHHHPYEFYLRLGYRIVGVIPDANGPNMPDILMWKRVRRSG